MYSPELSIVIPTRNRQTYCLAAVKQILSLNLPNTEIVIQDNSDNDYLAYSMNTEEMKKNNVGYNYSSDTLSFVNNFNKAIEASSGKYLCIIGDDDGILPSIVDAIRLAKEENVDAIIPALSSIYFWPDSQRISGGGNISLYPIKHYKITKVDPINSLDNLIKNSFQGYQQIGVPRIYHGIISRKCLDDVKRHTGSYFNGLSPDIYMSVALCFTCKKVVKINYPITISGICPRSGSADSATGRHTGELKDAPHFRGHDKYSWAKEIPYLYTVETIWAESGMKALRQFSNEKADRFSLRRMAIVIYSNYPQFRKRCKMFLKGNGIISTGIFFQSIVYRLQHFYKKAKHAIPLKIGPKTMRLQKYSNISDIEEAAIFTMDKIFNCK